MLALALAEQARPFEVSTLAALAGALLLLAALFVRERTAEHPLVPPALLRSRPLSVALVAAALLTATTSGGGVLATLHLQAVLGLAPTSAGLLLLPFSLAVVAGSTAAARASASASTVIAGGIALIAAGSAAAAASLTATSGSAGIVAWGVLAGLGLGAASVAATTLGTATVDEADRGPVAGLLNTAAQVGTALGVAALVLVAGTTDAAGGHRIGFAAAAALAVLGIVFLRAHPPRASQRDPSPSARREPSNARAV